MGKIDRILFTLLISGILITLTVLFMLLLTRPASRPTISGGAAFVQSITWGGLL